MLAKTTYGRNETVSSKEQKVDDQTLWQSFKKSNDFAFSILYNRYVHRLYNYGMHACKDAELVKDCIQELFTRLWDTRDTVSVARSVNSYLLLSFRRILMERLRRKRKFSLFVMDDRAFEFSPSIEDDMVNYEFEVEIRTQLKAGLNHLTKRQREVIFLKFYNNLTYAEVAKVMELHVDSVYNLISKAIESLRKAMKTTTIISLFLALLST